MFDSQTILWALGAVAAAYFGGQWLLSKGNEIEDRRREAAELAAVLKGLGLNLTGDILLDYSVGDYGGMAAKIAQVVKLFTQGEEAILSEFSKVFDRLLEARLKSPIGRTYIAAKLKDAAQEGDGTVVSDVAGPENLTAPKG